MCDSCNWQHWVGNIDEMLTRGRDTHFEQGLLEGIREWAEDNQHITEKQIGALEDIEGR